MPPKVNLYQLLPPLNGVDVPCNTKVSFTLGTVPSIRVFCPLLSLQSSTSNTAVKLKPYGHCVTLLITPAEDIFIV